MRIALFIAFSAFGQISTPIALFMAFSAFAKITELKFQLFQEVGGDIGIFCLYLHAHCALYGISGGRGLYRHFLPISPRALRSLWHFLPLGKSPRALRSIWHLRRVGEIYQAPARVEASTSFPRLWVTLDLDLASRSWGRGLETRLCCLFWYFTFLGTRASRSIFRAFSLWFHQPEQVVYELVAK